MEGDPTVMDYIETIEEDYSIFYYELEAAVKKMWNDKSPRLNSTPAEVIKILITTLTAT